jgi:hypothetical protein
MHNDDKSSGDERSAQREERNEGEREVAGIAYEQGQRRA